MVARRVISALIFLVAAVAFAGPFVVLDTAESTWGQRHTTISISGFNLILGTTPSIRTEGDERSGDSSIPGLAEAAANAPNSPAALTDGSEARVTAVVALLLTLGATALAAFRTGRGLGALSALLAVSSGVALVWSTDAIKGAVEDSDASKIFPDASMGGGAEWALVMLAAGAFFVFLDAMVTGAPQKPFVPLNMSQGQPPGYGPPGYPQPGYPQQGFAQQGFPQQGFPPQASPQQGFAQQAPYPQQQAPQQQPYPQQQAYPVSPQPPHPPQSAPPQPYPAQGHPTPQGPFVQQGPPAQQSYQQSYQQGFPQQGYPPQAPPSQVPQSGPPFPQSGPPYPPPPPQPPYGAPYGS
ncbi:hypothetical protein ACIA8K_32145 [Catenuloplanes sp. NPDC051500]|uniref:hypothetical protein n=1 Tax=Catenuloplanes sp. NPDC051500 TaxID=3363959 RepID=UPI0037BD6B86